MSPEACRFICIDEEYIFERPVTMTKVIRDIAAKIHFEFETDEIRVAFHGYVVKYVVDQRSMANRANRTVAPGVQGAASQDGNRTSSGGSCP